MLYLLFDQGLTAGEVVERGYPEPVVSKIVALERAHRFKRRLMLIARLSGSARFYVPVVRDWLTFAVRFVGDALMGDVPFYELAKYQDSYAFGGSKGVRGVPGQRYHGKLKLFSNVELRSQLVRFRAFGNSNNLGLAGFFDFGRLWADYSGSAELDGSELGLKNGTGGGLRWAAGKSFVLRFDVAWSPDADPVGAYLAAGHTF